MRHLSIGYIYLVLPNGKYYPWRVSCHPIIDNPESLRKHAEKWRPKCKFIGAEIFCSEEDKEFFRDKPTTDERKNKCR